MYNKHHVPHKNPSLSGITSCLHVHFPLLVLMPSCRMQLLVVPDKAVGDPFHICIRQYG